MHLLRGSSKVCFTKVQVQLIQTVFTWLIVDPNVYCYSAHQKVGSHAQKHRSIYRTIDRSVDSVVIMLVDWWLGSSKECSY